MTHAVAWPKRTSISLTFAEPSNFKFCRQFSTNYQLRQPMNWAPFVDAPRTCAASPASRILDDSSTWHVTSKTESWAPPVSTSSSTSEAPIAQARDMPPLLSDPRKTPRITDEQGSTIIMIIIWMSTEGKETGTTTADDLSLEI